MYVHVRVQTILPGDTVNGLVEWDHSLLHCIS